MATTRQAHGPRSPRGPRAPHNPNRRVVRRDTRDFAKPGAYRKDVGGPGRGPYNWKAAPPLDAVDFAGGGWVTAPGSSHLADFRFIYGIDEPRQVGRFTMPDPGSAPAYLQVRFKDGGWAAYWSDRGSGFDALRLETIFHLMESAEHPGEIIWSHLITDRWPYDTSA